MFNPQHRRLDYTTYIIQQSKGGGKRGYHTHDSYGSHPTARKHIKMLLEVSPEGMDYLRELASISDPTDEDDEQYRMGLKVSSAKSERQAEDEMVLQLYSALGPKEDTYFSNQYHEPQMKSLMQRVISRLYEAEYLVDAEDGINI